MGSRAVSRRRAAKATRGIGLLVLGIAVAVAAGYAALRSWRQRSAPPDGSAPIVVAESVVRGRLGSGAILHFSPAEWTQVEQLGDTATVRGLVEVIPRSGVGVASYNYECVLHREDRQRSWNLLNLQMLKQ